MCINGEHGGEVENVSELDRCLVLCLDVGPGSVRPTGRLLDTCVTTDTDAGEIRSPPLKLSKDLQAKKLDREPKKPIDYR